METFNTTVQDFLNELTYFKGRAPLFSIDYQRKELMLIDSPSGFIKQLASNGNWALSLVSSKGILLSKFS